jgi:hypothetical protein
MASLADEWEAGQQTCIDVLCAYMRMPYLLPQPDEEMNRVTAGNAANVRQQSPSSSATSGKGGFERSTRRHKQRT